MKNFATKPRPEKPPKPDPSTTAVRWPYDFVTGYSGRVAGRGGAAGAAVQEIVPARCVGYLFAGVVISPSVIGVVHEPRDDTVHCGLGVTLLMFIIGLDYNARRLWALRRSIFEVSARCIWWCASALAALAVGQFATSGERSSSGSRWR